MFYAAVYYQHKIQYLWHNTMARETCELKKSPQTDLLFIMVVSCQLKLQLQNIFWLMACFGTRLFKGAIVYIKISSNENCWHVNGGERVSLPVSYTFLVSRYWKPVFNNECTFHHGHGVSIGPSNYPCSTTQPSVCCICSWQQMHKSIVVLHECTNHPQYSWSLRQFIILQSMPKWDECPPA